MLGRGGKQKTQRELVAMNPDDILPVVYAASEDAQTEADIKANFDELDLIFSEDVELGEEEDL